MNSEIDPKSSEMHDVAVARNLIDEIFDLTTPGRRSIVIGLTIAALKRVERALDPTVLRERGRQWTERRVRSIVDNEARRIDAYEIEDLNKVKLEEAKHDFQRSTARAARLATLLSAQDEDFHGPEIDRLRELARGVGSARNCGAAE